MEPEAPEDGLVVLQPPECIPWVPEHHILPVDVICKTQHLLRQYIQLLSLDSVVVLYSCMQCPSKLWLSRREPRGSGLTGKVLLKEHGNLQSERPDGISDICVEVSVLLPSVVALLWIARWR